MVGRVDHKGEEEKVDQCLVPQYALGKAMRMLVRQAVAGMRMVPLLLKGWRAMTAGAALSQDEVVLLLRPEKS